MLRQPGRNDAKYRRAGSGEKIDNFAHWLLDALKADAQRSKSDRVWRIFLRSDEGSQLYRQQGVTDVVRRWRFEAGAVTARPAYVPLSFDWSEEGIAIGASGAECNWPTSSWAPRALSGCSRIPASDTKYFSMPTPAA